MTAGMAPVVVLLCSFLHTCHQPPPPPLPAYHFYVTMYIGEPKKPYFLDIDTGSNLTWLECDAGSGSCETCNKVPHPLYQATPEKRVPCAHPLCKALHKDLHSAQKCRNEPRSQCDCEIHYLDGSSSLGLLIFHKFSFTTGNVHPTIAFGCGYDQVDEGMGENMLVDGMFGLGRGSVDLVSQLKQQKIITQNVIGHCFNSKGGGFRIIGKDVPSSSHISWVPMSKNSKYYSPGRATLRLDMKSIVTKPMEVVLGGSTYTHFPEDLHDQLVAALKASLSKSSVEEVHDPALPLCWKGPRPFKSVDDLKKELKPLLSLNFGGGVTMKIPPENYLIITRHGNACFAILAKKEIDLYIIGDITMQDQLVIYDNENERISWQQYPCGELMERDEDKSGTAKDPMEHNFCPSIKLRILTCGQADHGDASDHPS